MTVSDYDYSFKVLLIGNSGVGKSSILSRYVDGDFAENLAKTIGVDFKTKNLRIDSQRVKLQIWDTAGQERYRTITSTFYRGAVGVIMVYDITDIESFNDIARWVEHLREEFLDSDLPVLYIGGNKCDLESERQVDSLQARRYANKHGFSFLELSAQSDHNVTEIFKRLSCSILKEKHLLSQSSLPGMDLSETVNLNSPSYDTHSSYFGQRTSTRSFLCCRSG